MPVGLGDESKGWKLLTSGTRSTIPVSPADLQLLNRFCALAADDEMGTLFNEVPVSYD